MTEKLLTPSAAVGGGEGSNNSRANALNVNAYRIAAVIERLGFTMQRMKLMQQGLSQNDASETSNLCISLSRGIDFAIANNEVPSRAPDLPSLLKQVCQCKDNQMLQAAVMVLMISVKNACECGWFSEKDSEDLNNLAREITSDFCTTMDFNTDPSSCNAVIADIMSRFYPKMIMGQILTFLEIKPGYGAYVVDFQVSKTTKYKPGEKIRLFVACKDSTETSACIISPQKVSFLINGKEVDKRTRLYVDRGSQMPTNVTFLMKYGSNVLQALGQFDGNYIIVVALMSELSAIEDATLQDYVQPDTVTEDPDSELIVGASRISLNCPISFKRIKTPVKGQSCKHFQCFDYDNYITINSKSPSWRCPHCNHHCCFPEIRLDQNIAKILREVGENVNNVIISSEGSWKAIENNEDAEKQKAKVPRLNPEEPDSSAPSNHTDLIEIDDVTVNDSSEAEDVKFLQNGSANQSSIQNPMLQQAGDSYWSGIFMSTFQTGTLNALPDSQIGAVPEPNSSMASTSNTGVGTSLQNNYQHFNQPVIRNPVAVQALPAAQARNNPSTSSLGASQTSASPADALRARLSNMEERLQSPLPHPSVIQVPFPQQHSNHQPQDRTLYPAISQAQSSSPRGPQMHTSNHSAPRFQQSAAAFGNGFRPQSNPAFLQTQRVGVHMRGFPTSMGPTTQPAQVNLALDQEWRPTGRMRGSLTGQAQIAALNQYSNGRAQPSQNSGTPTRPNSNDALIQILLANRAAMDASSSSQTRPTASSTPSPSGSIPPMPPGSQ